MSRKIEEIQKDIRTLTRVPSMFINAKLDELAEEVGQIKADAIEECIAEINKLNIEIAYPHTICNILEMLKENKR